MLTHHIDAAPLLRSFQAFSNQAKPILHIHNDDDYVEALNTLESLFEMASDSEDDPAHGIITLVANAVERYESTLPEVKELEAMADAMDNSISLLRLLMQNHGLTGSDFENEIGKKSYVSMILNGDRNLTKDHISKLSKRFHISPALFF